MYVGCILPVSIYMCTMRLIELTVAWQNSKPVQCKMHAFIQNSISFSHCYTMVLYEPISKLYMYKNSVIYLSDCRVTFFLQGTGIEKPDSY